MTPMSGVVLSIKVIICFSAIILAAVLFPLAGQSEISPTDPILSDEFGRVGECEFGGRLDSFLTELSDRPTSYGYIINYKSSDELPGDRDSFARERMISNHIAFRNFDSSRITIVRGGYRSDVMTELWLVPHGAKPPEPSRTVPEPKVANDKTFLYVKRYLDAYESDGNLGEFVLASVREEERSSSTEVVGEEVDVAPEYKDAASEESQPEVDEDDPPEYVDERTDAEKEADKFRWADIEIAQFLSADKGSSSVIIFYVDDQRYDIGRLRGFIERGRDRLAAASKIPVSRFRIEFGGYRDTPEVEFWLVPAKGKAPVPTPEERPVEQPEEAPDS